MQHAVGAQRQTLNTETPPLAAGCPAAPRPVPSGGGHPLSPRRRAPPSPSRCRPPRCGTRRVWQRVSRAGAPVCCLCCGVLQRWACWHQQQMKPTPCQSHTEMEQLTAHLRVLNDGLARPATASYGVLVAPARAFLSSCMELPERAQVEPELQRWARWGWVDVLAVCRRRRAVPHPRQRLCVERPISPYATARYSRILDSAEASSCSASA